MITPRPAPHLIAPSHPLVRQQRRRYPVVQLRLRPHPSPVRPRRMQPHRKSVRYIQPDHRQQLPVVHRNPVLNLVPDKSPPPFQTPRVRQPPESVARPVLPRQPNQHHHHAHHNQQPLARQQPGQNQPPGGNNPQIANHTPSITPTPPLVTHPPACRPPAPFLIRHSSASPRHPGAGRHPAVLSRLRLAPERRRIRPHAPPDCPGCRLLSDSLDTGLVSADSPDRIRNLATNTAAL